MIFKAFDYEAERKRRTECREGVGENLKPKEHGLTQEEYDRLSDGSTLAAEKKRADQWAEKAGLKMPPFEEILRRSSLPRERWEPNVRLYKPLLWHRMQYLQAICSLEPSYLP